MKDNYYKKIQKLNRNKRATNSLKKLKEVEKDKLKLRYKILAGLIVIFVGLHILNWKMEGFGWKGNLHSQFMQVMCLPWSLI
jgi:hypothetical protein